MPSPTTFKVFDNNRIEIVNGYHNRKSDSFAMHKKGEGKNAPWEVIHKASGNSVSSAISAAVTGYPKTLALIAHVQENALESLQILDRMTIGEMPTSPDQKAAARHIQQVIQSFKG